MGMREGERGGREDGDGERRERRWRRREEGEKMETERGGREKS